MKGRSERVSIRVEKTTCCSKISISDYVERIVLLIPRAPFLVPPPDEESETMRLCHAKIADRTRSTQGQLKQTSARRGYSLPSQMKWDRADGRAKHSPLGEKSKPKVWHNQIIVGTRYLKVRSFTRLRPSATLAQGRVCFSSLV